MKVFRWIAAFAVSATALASVGDTSTTWKTDLAQWRAHREQGISAPDGWLTLVGLDWLKPGDNAVGSAADSRVQLGASVPAHLAVIALQGDTLQLKPPAGGFPAGLKVDGEAAKPMAIKDDQSDQPTKFSIGTISFYVIHRGDRYAARIKDSQAPMRVNFHGLHWYAPNPKYVVTAQWHPSHPYQKLRIPTEAGNTLEMDSPGEAEFTIDGKTVKILPVIEDPKSDKLFFILRDATSGKTSYGAARFLDTEFPDHGLDHEGTLRIDFNRLENPPCAYTPYATCPLPPEQNKLHVALPVGEAAYAH